MHNLPTLKHSHKEVGCNTTPLLLDSAAVVGAAWGLVTPLESGPKGRSSPRRARGAACEAPRETGFAPPSRQKRGETVPAPAPCTTARFGTHSGAFVRVRARAPALLLCSAESVSQSVGDCPRSRQSEGTWTSQLPEYFISPPLLPPRVSLHPSPALARVAMAEPSAATQSPSISSSSSGAEPSAPGGGGSPGGCPALGTKSCSSSCADSFVSSSSSQPVSLFSTSQVSGDGVIEKDSPESPFEVIIDKAAFDKEFKDSYKENTDDFGSWSMHTDRESSEDISETNDKLFPLRNKEAGRYPMSALLSRQFSHTNAALEEVSRCVNDMHNFTNEILTWDLVPQVKQQTDKSCERITKTTGLVMSEYNSEIPVVNLKTNTDQKIPVCSVNGSTPITKSTDDWAEASLPQENAITGKPIADPLSSTKEVSIRGVQGNMQKQDDILAELPESTPEKCDSLGSGVATVKVVLSDDHLKDEMNWQSSALGEITEADSSGESDDTVIEDITAESSFENNKIQAEKPVFIRSNVVKTGEREIKEIPSCKREEETTKNFEELVSDSELHQDWPDILERSPAGEAACPKVPDMNISLDVKQSDKMSEVVPENPITTQNPKPPSTVSPNVFNETEFSLNVTTSAYLESLHGKNVKHVDDSSPEDLVAAFAETRQKGIVASEGNAFKAGSEKMTDFKTALPVEKVLHENEPGSSEIKDIGSKYSEQSKETNGSEPLGVFPTQGTPVAPLDLEQEQLTIKALKELGERQAEKSASAQHDTELPSEEVLKQTFTFAPESWPQRSCDILEHNVKNGSDLGISQKPTAIRETTRVDAVSSLSKTELVKKHVLARLLTNFSVHDLIFWRDVKKTGFVFGTTLIMLLSLAAFSVISVVSYLILALLSVTISFRVYKSVIQAVQKSEEGHPFKAYLDVDITLSSEAFHNYMNAAMVHINRALKLIIRLFLVEDLVDSLKLAVFMWLMTYVGAVFNGITLLILAELLIFSVPIVYEKYKTQIDHYVGIARDQTKSIVEKIQAKLPGIAKKKAE
ncbi:reticulon-3 isoform X2 [Sapajus apella]|uniref:Reticulon n=1 Tax=Sapajus apella TaxID=9515 RepID=A0A6J3I9A3_SAPAP|nr:reticulon-3 isoform X2 [Sapajus apella]